MLRWGMNRRLALSFEELADRLAWGLYINAALLGFPKRGRSLSLSDCIMVAKRQIEHLRISGVAVDEIYRLEAPLHSSSGCSDDVR
jgi:hypothetical protein